MPKPLSHVKIALRRSADRGYAEHGGWLKSHHTFSFASYYDHRFTQFGSLRVLNEDRVAARNGFPTHPHRDAEIFSYILSGELTHRDSMIKRGAEGAQGDDFYRMKRGDVQFTTGGTGIAHSEMNESGKAVHFLQIWALPWKRGLKPRYHTKSFGDEDKRSGFVTVLSPLKAGVEASEAQEEEAEPVVKGSIPIHADFVMGAGILAPETVFEWKIGGGEGVVQKRKRNVYVHLPASKKGGARVELNGMEDAVLEEGDGAFVEGASVGDVLRVRSLGDGEAELVVLDSD
ncbi:putative pirin domain protein [Aspergillus steynii IBT 23096]|uniref:Putative pirin domain protein n=1 Tax=Aspergillus steynii IBT 23096 TaxID=1392250 RepID=A0A2I2G7E6_9EURO|nr:putative pirin domain protein [Aspergillus steynii IBT 23096]PLB48806.1 putative pirin domain protein [Aspergillus steynii IBT 23096]